MEPAVEAVGRFGQLAPRVVGLYDGAMHPADRCMRLASTTLTRGQRFLGRGATATGMERGVRMAGLLEPA
jgi:hypothetical protein